MLSVGQSIGNYRIVRVLGEGGMGQVFEAVQDSIGTRVAIKALHPHLSKDTEIVNRFLNEGRAVNLIKHPSLVTIFEQGKLPDETVYIVMEFLEGESLAKRIENSGLTIPDSMRLCRQIASALQAAHDKGIIHRDLKPENVVIVSDPEAVAGERAKILDFGIAKLAEEHQGPKSVVKTAAGMLLGTPLYMSPEQCDGAVALDGKSDVYSLGVILYEMLAGQPPFVSHSVSAIMMMQVSATPKPIREVNPIVPEALAKLVHEMLKKMAAERPTMAEVARALESLSPQRTGQMSIPKEERLKVSATKKADPLLRDSFAETVHESGLSEIKSAPAGPAQDGNELGPAVPSKTPVPMLAPSTSGARMPSPEERPQKSQAGNGKGILFAAIGAAVLLLGGVGGLLFLRPTKARVSIRLSGDVGAGKVLSEPLGIDCGDVCMERFAKGKEVLLTAIPDPRYSFAGWSGDCAGTEPCKLQVKWEREVEARFVRLPEKKTELPVAPQRPMAPARRGSGRR